MEPLNEVPDVDDEQERSVISSESSEAERSNRFKGPKSTWRRLTEDERLVSTSMTRLRGQDLSVHLYNAHTMKRRHYEKESVSSLKPWANKDRWRGNIVGEDNESSANFVPPRSWTAWPLSADVVPRAGEQIGIPDGADEWTLRRNEFPRPSRELEDALTAIVLRISRDRFEKREWESSQENGPENAEDGAVSTSSGSGALDSVTDEEELVDRSRNHPPSHEDVMEEVDRARRVNQDAAGGDASRVAEQISDDIPLGRPTISADDEGSRQLMRPTVRHTLSRLDELLMALHHARQTCLHYASEHTESQSEFEGANTAAKDSDNNDPSHPPPSTTPRDPSLEQPPKRSKRGRPPKQLHMPTLSPAVDNLESIEPSKTERRGRKRKFHVPLDGESHQEMLVRIARQQKKAIPFTSPPTGYASSSPTKSGQGSPVKRGTSAQAREKRSARLGLRDWSEVIGTAALLGFAPAVIDRATQRCTNLFGEGMTLLSLVENPKSEGEDGDQIMDYVPGGGGVALSFDDLAAHHDGTTGSESNAGRRRRRPSKRGSRSSVRSDDDVMEVSKSEEGRVIRSSSGVDLAMYYCSITECRRRKRGFSKRHYLKRHLRDVHKLDGEALREAAREDSQEEMEGGVHVDGFMKVVKRRTGWRAVDGKLRHKRRSRPRVESEETDEDVTKEEERSEKSSHGLVQSDGSLDEAFESD